MARALLLEQSTSNVYRDKDFADFIDELVKGNVLLVVGKAFEANQEEYKGCNYANDSKPSIYGWILDALNKAYKTDASTFSDLAADRNFFRSNDHRRCDIHTELKNAVSRADFTIKDVSSDLIKLLQTGYFKFVFTASFTPLVEIAMRQQWGDIRVKNVYAENTMDQDINAERDLNVPSLYYLFGKASRNTFVATDVDALEAVRRWLQNSRDSQLLKMTSRRYILTLGCDYDDWLFRMIWFILKGDAARLKDGYVAQYSNEKSLERFLIRNKILIDNDASKVVEAITSELQRREETYNWKNPNHCDVFISYSRKDGQVAEQLYESLKNKGLNVWYDKLNLAGRGDEFKAKISNAIRNCKVFIPILTSTISAQRDDEHPYSEEWEYALQHYSRIGRHDFCIPLVEDLYDVNWVWYDDRVPEKFIRMDYTMFNYEDIDLEDFSKNIQDIVLNR